MPNLSDNGWAFVVELKDTIKETERYEERSRYNSMIDDEKPAMFVGYRHTWPPRAFPDGDFSNAENSILSNHGEELLEEKTGSSRSRLLPLLRDAEELVHEFRGRGHAVFSVGRYFTPEPGRRQYHVYVIRLPAAARDDERVQSRVSEQDPDEGMPCVYVGETSRDPTDRLEQHLAGGRNSNTFVERYGGELDHALYEHLNPLTRLEALRQERDLARRLRRAGYRVLSN